MEGCVPQGPPAGSRRPQRPAHPWPVVPRDPTFHHRIRRRTQRFHTAQRRDPGPYGFGQIAEAGLAPDSISHKQTCCLFHRAAVACCPHARACLGVLIKVADCYACHDHIFQWYRNPLPRAIAMQSRRQRRARRDRLQIPMHPPAWSTSMRSLDMQTTGGFRTVRFRFLENRLCSCSSLPGHFLSGCAAAISWVRSGFSFVASVSILPFGPKRSISPWSPQVRWKQTSARSSSDRPWMPCVSAGIAPRKAMPTLPMRTSSKRRKGRSYHRHRDGESTPATDNASTTAPRRSG